ncbi:hypothetical protein [Pontibacter populi]|uniref:Outer membrane protein beta-barrel domain-containing protein n=1 Tax=Pontibacter populi TaxID=890055 RepID=A0ABV1RXD7_9BACT
MIRFYLVLALCVVSMHAVAQNEFTVQHSLYVGAGISMAPEDLAGIESIDDKGYVQNGPTIALNYVARFHRYMAVGATIGHSRNDLNSAAVAQSFSSSTSVQTEPYTLTFLMADVYGLFPVKQWQFYAKGSLGSMLPDVWEMKIKNDVGSGSIKSGSKFEPAYAGTLGVNYNFGKISLGLESALLASEPEFEFELNQSVTYKKQWLSAFNHMVKAGIRF